MKKSLLILSLALSPLLAKAQPQSEAGNFLESLNKEFLILQEMQVDYLSHMVHGRGTTLEGKREELQNAVSSAVTNVSALNAPANDKGLKKAALETFKGMDDMTKKDHSETILKKAGCTDCFAAVEVEYKEMKATSDEVNKAFSKMQKKIEDFAKENDIKLIDSKSEFDVILGKVNRINDYLQELDICVQQAHYASEDVVKSFNEKNQKIASAAVKKMGKEMNEAMKRLKSVSAIPEDAICLKKAQLLLDFYQKMADEIYPDMLGAFDKKGEITQAGVNIFNKNIEKIGKQLPPKSDAYQQSKAELLLKNVPKPTKSYKG